MGSDDAEQAATALSRRLTATMVGIPESDITIATRLDALCSLLAHELDFTGCTVTLLSSDQVQAVAARSPAGIAVVDSVGFDTGEGPTLDAFTSRKPVLVADLLACVGRWPGYVYAMSTRGVSSVHAFPLQFGATRCGVLTCYGNTASGLSPVAISTCAVYADVMTQSLLRRGAGPVSWDDVDELSTGVAIRNEVYQAQGMIKSALDTSLDDALAQLRAAAFATGLSLNEMAADIVARRRSSTLDDVGDGGPADPPAPSRPDEPPPARNDPPA